MDMYRIVNARIVETWHIEALAAMMRQIDP